MEELEKRVVELEVQTALQDELLQSLNDTVARLNETLALQQGQLRLLYGRLQEKGGDAGRFNPTDEVPPHY